MKHLTVRYAYDRTFAQLEDVLPRGSGKTFGRWLGAGGLVDAGKWGV